MLSVQPMSRIDVWQNHPCLSQLAHEQVGRIHLPVAPKCNIKCVYCDRKICADLNMQHPGWARTVLSPREAVEFIRELIDARADRAGTEGHDFVAGVAGPGDPLANDETFETLEQIHHEYPDLITCLSTNGLLLEQKLSRIIEVGVSALTVTVNALDWEVGRQIYSWARFDGKTFRGKEAAKIIITNQMKGIRAALEAGLALKINTVLIPGVNDGHVRELAAFLGRAGVRLMNIMPLIPAGRLKDHRAPTCSELHEARSDCEKMIPQFWWCKQCSADVVHFPTVPR
jgi:nitrogen fixation protein NifB